MNTPLIYVGQVMHHRLLPKTHRFTYKNYLLRCSVANLEALKIPFFSLERFNLFSFYQKDHGARDGSSLDVWARTLLRANQINTVDGEIVLYALPRVLGYVFNPVSFWFCHDAQGDVRAILCEVNNTFGERHIYLLAQPDQQPIEEGQALSCKKIFHVSPFMATEGSYRFNFHWKDKAVFCINHHDDAGNLLLVTALSGQPSSYNSRNLLKLFMRFFWLTAAVVLRIHWHAFLLWSKGLKFFRKPAPPNQKISR